MTPEGQLLKAVKRYLTLTEKLTGLVWWRANAGGGLRGRRVIRGNPEGTPDVLLILPPSGRLVGLELKSPAGKHRTAQLAWAEHATRAGAIIWTIRSIDELQTKLREQGIDAP